MSKTTTDESVPFSSGCSPVCDVVRRPKRRKKKSRSLHRVLGILASVPLIWVLVTGFFLNHAEDFKLDAKKVSARWVMEAYGMLPEGVPRQVSLKEMNLLEWDGLVFLNGQVVEQVGTCIGGGVDGEVTVVVFENAVLRYDATGELIETLDELSLPALPLRAVGQQEGKVLLQNEEGWHQADADWIEWQRVGNQNIKKVELLPLEDKEQQNTLLQQWHGGGVSYYRVLLDLHAGNFLGDFAKYFYDFVILCTLWLIGTGIVLQYRTSKRSSLAKS